MNVTPGASAIKLFTTETIDLYYKLECFPLSVTSTLVLYFQARLEPIIVDPHMELLSDGVLSALLANIRLGWK